MKRKITIATVALAVSVSMSPMLFGQMEKRKSEEYILNQFTESKPTMGETIPELTLCTLEGESVQLADYLGKNKNIVLIKGSFT